MRKISFRNDVLPLKNVLYRLALRITMNREEAEDVVQDTMMKIWDRRDTLQDVESIEAFSLTICRRLALDKTKKMSRQDESLDQEDYGLPEKQKTCMQLRDFEGKSYKDIARVLSITEEQVKVNIYRARQAVKQKFNENAEYGL